MFLANVYNNMKKTEHFLKKNNLFVEELIPDEELFSHPIVLVHGSFGNHMMWEMISSELVRNGFHCFAISLRGHSPSGEVDLGEIGMTDYVDDIKQIIEEFDLKNPVIVGHSMAGLLVMMYAQNNHTYAVISIDPSPSKEVQGKTDEEKIKSIPDVYNAMDVGLPITDMEVMKMLPDIPKEMLMKMKEMLGDESGKARRDRKRGISISHLKVPFLILGAELGDSVPFGIAFEKSKKMSEYYNADFMKIKGATHPGILMGEHSDKVSKTVIDWLKSL